MDKPTGRHTAPVTTGQIYWGAIPFVLIQLVMVTLLIAFPQMSLVYKSGAPVIDINKVKIELPGDEPAKPGTDDLMKDLQKDLGGKAPGDSKAPAQDEKSPEDKAAEDLQKALGGK